MTELKKGKFATLPILLFCIAAGLIATLWGYDYSAGNSMEQLPFIYRAMNPSWLANDFFTNTFSQFGPRTVFSEFVAFFARFMPLTVVVFLLAVLSNISIAYLSSLTAGYFFKNSKFSAFLAAAGVLTLKTFWLGYSNIIYRTYLEPSQLATPLLFLGFYLILQRKQIFAAISFGLASLFHPLFGLEIGWLLLGTSVLIFVLQVIKKKAQLKGGLHLLISCAILLCFSALLILPYTSQPSISADTFIKIIAYIRHPHHYLPSTFELWQYQQAAIYLFAFILIFIFALNRSDTLKQHKNYLVLLFIAILFLCLGGYLFVEVWPSRIWTSAQMFRIPYILKWLSLVIMCGWVGNIIESPAKNGSRFFGFISGVSMLTPISMAFIAVISGISRWVKIELKPRLRFIFEIFILTVSIAGIVFYKPDLRSWLLFLFFFFCLWIMYALKWKSTGTMISTSLSALLSLVFFLYSTKLTPPQFLQSQVPFFGLYHDTGEVADMARFAKTNTPEDAIFLTLPKFAEFRYMADRAIIVDIIAFPFQDQSMLQWYQRMLDCYGASDLLGFNALPELNHRFHSITDTQLLELAQKYGANYADIYSDTPTNFKILHQTESFQLIQITQ